MQHDSTHLPVIPSTRGHLRQLRESVKSGKVETDNSNDRPSDIKIAVSRTERNCNVHGSMHLQDGPSLTTSGSPTPNYTNNLSNTINAGNVTRMAHTMM